MLAERLQNIYFSAHATKTLERCFFKGVVSKVLPGIQTAFVDIGQEKAGFLHISEIDRELAIERMSKGEGFDDLDDEEETSQRIISRREMDMSKILKEGEHVLVQVSKEPIYEKGAKLTTCFTLPGRFIVLMPNIPRIGISKKIEGREARQRLRDLLRSNLPEGMGAIIRTSCDQQSDSEILQDVRYLVDTWYEVLRRYENAKPTEKIFEDIDLKLQAVRDNLDDDVEAVVVDNKEAHDQVCRFVKEIAPEFAHKIKLYQEPPALFDKYGVETQIEEALNRKVYLRSGGSIIVETTEAMTVVDVNTGRYTGKDDMEDTILRANLEAAEEIVRQLRLRNIGGLIVIDFIDMASNQNRQKLFRHLERTLKERDKFQSVVLRVSEFGLVQMTRKRSGKTLMQQIMESCDRCQGLGMVKSLQTQTYTILRKLRDGLERKTFKGPFVVRIHPTVFEYITTTEYNSILNLEKQFDCPITLGSDEHETPGNFSIAEA